MKLDDEDEFNLLDNNNNPNNLSAIESPEKMNLLDGSSTMRPPTPLHLKKNFASPFGVGGNDGHALPNIFSHKPRLDPKMLMTPSKANNVAFPKRGGHSENAEEMVAKFQENSSTVGGGFDEAEVQGKPRDTKNALMNPDLHEEQHQVDDDMMTQKASTKKSKKVKKKVKKKKKAAGADE